MSEYIVEIFEVECVPPDPSRTCFGYRVIKDGKIIAESQGPHSRDSANSEAQKEIEKHKHKHINVRGI